MEILQVCSFYRTLDLNELTNLVDVVIDVRRDREAMKKWKGTKIKRALKRRHYYDEYGR